MDLVIIGVLVFAMVCLAFYSILVQIKPIQSFEGLVTKIDGNNITFDAVTFHCVVNLGFDRYLGRTVRFEYYIKDSLCWPCYIGEI